MVIRTYFDKNNTIISNTNINTGLNPVTELFYGGAEGQQRYSRFLFDFDETRLKSLHTDGTFADLTKLKHTLRMTNTGSFDKELLNTNMGAKERTTSFDLIAFKIGQDWDNGVGYDYEIPLLNQGDAAFINGESNWINPKTGYSWNGGAGVYSGSPTSFNTSSTGITVSQQHFDKGNENMEMDITDFVNDIISGTTNNFGLGIAYARVFEVMNTIKHQYVGFFTNNTQTFYEPFIESVYSNHIRDDRHNFYLDKPNKLYLYVNLAGNPTNLDAMPVVTVTDNNGTALVGPFPVTHVTKGVYSFEILVPTFPLGSNIETMYNDTWSGLVINGVVRPDLMLDFVVKDSFGYYDMSNGDSLPKKIGVNISGLQNNEKIKRGDIRKVLISARIPYTVEQTQSVSDIKYRLYVAEGASELTVIDYQPVEMAINHNYFLLDTASLVPNKYFLDVVVTSNLEVTTIKRVTQFTIVNQVELR